MNDIQAYDTDDTLATIGYKLWRIDDSSPRFQQQIKNLK